MGRRGDRQRGFGTVEVLIAVAVVAVIGLAGAAVYAHHKNAAKPPAKTSASSSNAATETTQQPAANLTTYSSSYGGFSFQYPTGWKVNEGQTGLEDEITISPVITTTATPTDLFTMTMWVTTNPDANFQPSALPNGSLLKLSNGISLWTSDTGHSARTSVTGSSYACPTMEIVNATSTHFSYALANGKYLTLEGGFCEGQGVQVTQTYQQQLASQDWQAAIAIVKSLQFN